MTDDEHQPSSDGAFSVHVTNMFGDPESALERARYELFTTARVVNSGTYYVPPIPFTGLARLLRVNPHHGAIPSLKANWVARYMLPNRIISRQTLVKAITDYEAMGNAFFQISTVVGGAVAGIGYLPTINTRRMVKDDCFCWLKPNTMEFVEFNPGEVVQVMQHDPYQQMYGMPYWIGALQSILMGEDVRIFPRLFFRNGGSTGDIVATSGLGKDEQTAVRGALDGIKGSGRFRRILLQFPRGEIDKTIKTMPYSTGSDKIDYSALARLSASDVLEAWRIRPELAGMMPGNTHGSTDLDKIREMYHENEIVPLQQTFSDAFNAMLPPRYWLRFKDYKPIEDKPVK